ncbi:hypothetical protein Pelo_16972 [Pelomyxa schiedti]|nr:hypothetical protein Pelo_16972 [Pelomyxa schiedti]
MRTTTTPRGGGSGRFQQHANLVAGSHIRLCMNSSLTRFMIQLSGFLFSIASMCRNMKDIGWRLHHFMDSACHRVVWKMRMRCGLNDMDAGPIDVKNESPVITYSHSITYQE